MSFLLVGLLLSVIPVEVPDPIPPAKVLNIGGLTEHVESVSMPGQRFTLYLPTGFDPKRPTPVIYLLDPRGRARVPAKVFQDAAQRYGYILVSSQMTASDGPMEPNLVAIQAMWDDINRWFVVDPNRTYIAGFSGTARVASLLAQHRPVTGVIGAGAGFHPEVQPSKKTPFLYFGAVGEVDYNFHEVATLESALAAMNLPHRVERFEGPHAWLTPEVAMRAVEWLELRAMQAGHRPVDASLIDAWWARDEALARQRIDEGRVLDGARVYAAMARDFAGLRHVADVAQAASRITKSTLAKADLQRRTSEARLSEAWVADAMQAIADAYPEEATEPVVAIRDLGRTIGLPALKATAAGTDRVAAKEAQRRLNQIEVQAGFYLPAAALARADYRRAGYYLSLSLLIDDASPVSWYLKAQLAAQLRDGQAALAALQRAMDAGFRDVSLLEADRAFVRLRTWPEYAALVDHLRAEGDNLDVRTVDRPPVHVSRY